MASFFMDRFGKVWDSPGYGNWWRLWMVLFYILWNSSGKSAAY